MRADHPGPKVNNCIGHTFQMGPEQALTSEHPRCPGELWRNHWVRRPKLQEMTVGLFSSTRLPDPQRQQSLWGQLFSRVVVCDPISPPRLCPLHPTHRRASGAVGRDLILLGAALLLGHGAKAILYSPEQHGVQVSILARGHLND